MGRIRLILIVLLFVSLQQLAGQTQKGLRRQPNSADTIAARFSMCNTIRGDTVMFKFPTDYEGLRRFFQKKLRYPGDIEDTVETTLCRLYFFIDRAGKVTDARCDAGSTEVLAREVIRVACKLGAFAPGYVKGKPVVTRVETRILFYDPHVANPDKLAEEHKADILLGAGIICRLPANRGHPH
ncbi:hypothetical protein A4D02_12200 [Niastella koreensis]|uniref:TonB C-terminal domain-containing protein n=2 Tax=Niastella koreensis TaxID=354356 RepID=G8TI94_NIAKG|nr:hypothetical protein [Niastella koreensis]AEW00711.1 hypothetical protein Niako_4452 [Niastella koreensis GR20-10]OQP42337.1 hypothetical protein A4D02_12200 [Niastella koreensis]